MEPHGNPPADHVDVTKTQDKSPAALRGLPWLATHLKPYHMLIVKGDSTDWILHEVSLYGSQVVI